MAAGSRREDATALPIGGLYVFVTAGLAYYVDVQNNGKGSAARQANAMEALSDLTDDRRIAGANAALPPGLPLFGGTFTCVKSRLTEFTPH